MAVTLLQDYLLLVIIVFTTTRSLTAIKLMSAEDLNLHDFGSPWVYQLGFIVECQSLTPSVSVYPIPPRAQIELLATVIA